MNHGTLASHRANAHIALHYYGMKNVYEKKCIIEIQDSQVRFARSRFAFSSFFFSFFF